MWYKENAVHCVPNFYALGDVNPFSTEELAFIL